MKSPLKQLTKNIWQHELDCKCNDKNCSVTILKDEPVVHQLQGCCDHFALKYDATKVLLKITSAARCYVYNRSKDVGSTDSSQHPRARAIDFKIYVNSVQIPPREIYEYLDAFYPNSHGIGSYKTFTHFDSRKIKARW